MGEQPKVGSRRWAAEGGQPKVGSRRWAAEGGLYIFQQDCLE